MTSLEITIRLRVINKMSFSHSQESISLLGQTVDIALIQRILLVQLPDFTGVLLRVLHKFFFLQVVPVQVIVFLFSHILDFPLEHLIPISPENWKKRLTEY
jgi:hypothetical protein